MPYPNWNPYYAAGTYQPPMPDQLAQLRANQYQQQMQQTNPVQMPQPTNNSIIWVQGEEAAKAYLVAPNTTVQLWDSENQTIYLKSADGSGMPTMRIIDYTERNTAPKPPVQAPQAQTVEYVTRDEFEALKAKFEALTTNTTKVKAKVKEEAE